MSKLGAVAPLIGAGLGIAGGIANASAMQATINKQKQANKDWAAYQKLQSRRTRQRETESRREAGQRFNEYLGTQGQTPRMESIDQEAARLDDYKTSDKGATGLSTGDVMLAAGDSSKSLNKALGREMTEATRRARENMRANSRVSAYGNSFGGMGTMDTIRGRDARGDIAGINDRRKGYVDVLQRYRDVPPLQYEYKPSPLGSILSGLSGAFMG